MSTFLTDMVNKGYTKKEVLDVFFESEEEKERRRISAIVTKAVDAIRLKNVREFLEYQQLATWKRMNVCMYVCMVITYSRVWINRVMALIELQMTRKIGLVVIVRFHSPQNSILLVCGLRWMR